MLQYWAVMVVEYNTVLVVVVVVVVVEKAVACLDDGPQCLALVYYSNVPPAVELVAAVAVAVVAAAAVVGAVVIPDLAVVADLVHPSPSSSPAALLSPPYSVDHAPVPPRQHSISPFLANPVPWHVASMLDR